MCIRYSSSSLRAFIFPSGFVLNQWWITEGCGKSWAALFGRHSFSSSLKSPFSGFLLTDGSLCRYLSIQQTISAGTSLLPTYLELSPVLVLAILLQGASAHAWLEDDSVSVFMEVSVQSDGCNSASPANICSLQGQCCAIYTAIGGILQPFTHSRFQHSCSQKSPGFHPLAISTKSQFIYFLFTSSQQPSCDSRGNPAQSFSINVSIIRALPSSTRGLDVLELLEEFSELKCKQGLSLEWPWKCSKKCHEVKASLKSCHLMPLHVCHLV